MEEEKRDTVGKTVLENMKKKKEKNSVIDITNECQKNYMPDLIANVLESRKVAGAKDFFVEVLAKQERLLTDTHRYLFHARWSCPTPNYGQDVWLYDHVTEDIVYIWTVPDREVAFHLYENMKIVHPSEKQLLDMVIAFGDGTLHRIMKELNHETLDTIELIQ